VNVVVLLINTIKNELPMTFVSLGVIVYPAIIAVNLSWPIWSSALRVGSGSWCPKAPDHVALLQGSGSGT
jgi:hypothetical protein